MILKAKKKIKTKWKLNDKAILRYEMSMLFIMLVVSVTIAWFAFSGFGTMSGLSMAVAEVKPYIRLSNDVDGGDLGEGEKIPLTFSKLNQTTLMPGTDGVLSVYITSMRDNISGCKIILKKIIPTYYDDTLSEEQQNQILDIVSRHIVFYCPEGEEKYEYKIKLNEGYIIPLETNEVKEIDINWIWPYSYSTIPKVDDPMNEELNKTYDMEDSQIGGLVKNLSFEFEFQSIVDEP